MSVDEYIVCVMITALIIIVTEFALLMMLALYKAIKERGND
jgi:hypothetical protein